MHPAGGLNWRSGQITAQLLNNSLARTAHGPTQIPRGGRLHCVVPRGGRPAAAAMPKKRAAKAAGVAKVVQDALEVTGKAFGQETVGRKKQELMQQMLGPAIVKGQARARTAELVSRQAKNLPVAHRGAHGSVQCRRAARATRIPRTCTCTYTHVHTCVYMHTYT